MAKKIKVGDRVYYEGPRMKDRKKGAKAARTAYEYLMLQSETKVASAEMASQSS